MQILRTMLVAFAALLGSLGASAVAAEGAPAAQVEGLITKPSAYSVDVTLERLGAGLEERGFVIFARLDHAAAAAAAGLTMPRATVVVFGNPRLGTAYLTKYPTLAIDLPLKALVWADAGGKVWLTYNTQSYLYQSAYERHGAPHEGELIDRVERALGEITDAAVR